MLECEICRDIEKALGVSDPQAAIRDFEQIVDGLVEAAGEKLQLPLKSERDAGVRCDFRRSQRSHFAAWWSVGWGRGF